MPLGASRLNFLAKTQEVAEGPARTAKTITANGDIQLDTAVSKFGGSSMLSDTSGDYLDVSPSIPASGDFTVEYWYYAKQSTVNRAQWGQGDGQTANDISCWALPNRTGITVRIGSNASKEMEIVASITFTADTWYHIALVRDGSTFELFINGTSYGTDTSSTTINQDDFRIRANGYTPTQSFGWGNFDEVRVSDTARYTSGFTAPTAPFVNDSNTLLLIHADGTDGDTVFIDDNGDRAPVGLQSSATYPPVVSTDQAKFGNSSIYFSQASGGNNTNNVVKGYVSDDGDFGLTSSDDFTAECWFYASEDNWEIMTHQTYNTNEGWTIFGRATGRIGYCMGYGPTTNTISVQITAGGDFSLNTWTHVALVKEGQRMSLFLDGSRVLTNDNAVFNNSKFSTDPFVLGHGYGVSSGFYTDNQGGLANYQGYIDEVRYSNTARYSGTTYTVPTAAFENDSNTLLLLHAEQHDADTTVIFDDNGQTLPTYTPPTQLWSDYDATNNGSEVVAHDDSSAGDGNVRQRVNMFDDTYGVVSYDKQNDTSTTYWRQITVSDTTITLGSENSYSSAIGSSNVTSQHGFNAATNKIIQGHMANDGTNYDLEYVVFTLSGSTVSASSVKTVDLTLSNALTHTNIFELDFDNGLFVHEGTEGIYLYKFDSGTDTLSNEDYFDYTSDGTTDFANVALTFLKIDTANFMLIGAKSDNTYYVTQGYNVAESGGTYTISELSGTATNVATYSGAGTTAFSRAGSNSKANSNPSGIFCVADSTNNELDMYPIKATTSSVTVGTPLVFNPTNSTSFARVDNSVWIDDSTYVGIFGHGDNTVILKPFEYDYSTNTISEYSPSVTETKINTDASYIFQARRADKIDAERIIVAWTEAGVDSQGDLTLKVIKAGPTS